MIIMLIVIFVSFYQTYRNGGWTYNQYAYFPTNLTSVVLTDERRIGYDAFVGCWSLTNVTLNSGMVSIGDYAFYNNPWYNGLTDEFVIGGDNVLIKYNGTKSGVTIPETVKSIAGGVFKAP